MELANREFEVSELVSANAKADAKTASMAELSDLQLALIGGGCGEVVFF